MPIFRYFVFVGGALLALLFAADHLLPSETVAVATPSVVINEQPTIRIRSNRQLPERVVLDTSQPPIVLPAAVASVANPRPQAASAATAITDASSNARSHQSHAEFAAGKPASSVSDGPELNTSDAGTSDARTSNARAKIQPPPARRKIARQHPQQPHERPVRVAQQPPFGLFDMTW